MSTFTIEKEFWSLFPEAKIGVIVVRGMNNSYGDRSVYESLLREAETHVKDHVPLEPIAKNRVVGVWREAFQQFKTKKGARSSIEALLKRVAKGDQLPTINPLVDLYNACSLIYALPNGGEDIDTFEGDLRLTAATGEEDFTTLGSNKSEPPYPGEIVYKDDAGAVCRCWNWREAVRTMLTEETTNAFLAIELVDPERIDALKEALDFLEHHITEELGGTCTVHLMDAENPQIPLAEA
jgi:DNA/RNA-binding domain of Phe-tRNA-synthetase-like protein